MPNSSEPAARLATRGGVMLAVAAPRLRPRLGLVGSPDPILASAATDPMQQLDLIVLEAMEMQTLTEHRSSRVATETFWTVTALVVLAAALALTIFSRDVAHGDPSPPTEIASLGSIIAP